MEPSLVQEFFETLNLIDFTFKNELKDIYDIIDNNTKIYKKVNELGLDKKLNPEERKNKIDEYNKKIDDMANELKENMEKNKDQYISYYHNNKNINNNEELYLDIETKEIIIDDNEEEPKMEIEDGNNNGQPDPENEIIINNNENNKNKKQFENLTEEKTAEFKKLYLDYTKYRIIYRNNYIFKSTNEQMIRLMYQTLKREHKLTDGIITEWINNNEHIM